jgi:hypothetical protein
MEWQITDTCFMSSISSITQSGFRHPSSSTPGTPLPSPTPAVNPEPPSVGSALGLPDRPSDKSFAAELTLPSPARNYSFASIGAIRAGHYTDF